MKKELWKKIQIGISILGFLAVALLIWEIIRTLMA